MEKNDYALYSSDLLRASQTADIVGAQLNLDVILEKYLHEYILVLRQEKPRIGQIQIEILGAKDEFDLDYREFQGGENWREFVKSEMFIMIKPKVSRVKIGNLYYD